MSIDTRMDIIDKANIVGVIGAPDVDVSSRVPPHSGLCISTLTVKTASAVKGR